MSEELFPSAVLGLRESPALLGSPSAAVPGTVCEIPDSESSSQGSARAVLPAQGGAGKPPPLPGLGLGLHLRDCPVEDSQHEG